MPRSGAQTRLRILDAAYGLFWRQGFVRVSVDQIADRAKLTKRTLYLHFRSKDDLIAAALTHSSELALSRLEKMRLPANRDALIDSIFSQLAEWASKPMWSGAGFSRVAAELADLRGHPARRIARQHKAAVEAWFSECLLAAGVPSPRSHAREIMLLMEGAMMLTLIHADHSYVAAAARAAKRLIREEQ